ncbi:MAG TPA: hypothetical protein VHB98_24920 [Chloroflexota bacterium]|jgi:hypothetical protein|nr:hypothetical protein [Chloroflexota bacterium]
MKILCQLALLATLIWRAPLSGAAHAAPACHPVSQTLLALSGRVDSLLAAGTSGTALALVAQPGSAVRFLPHDSLAVFATGDAEAGARTIRLPPYLMAPGLAARTDGSRFYVLVDSTLLTLDGSGRLVARQDLSMQAIGWPAAITTDASGNLYLIAQPAGAAAAQAYGLMPYRHGVLRIRWQTALGLTHAGSWIGLAGNALLAVYLPDQHDVHGTVALLDSGHGTMRSSYALPVPPIAADALRDRLYVDDAGRIRAFALHTGAPIAAVSGAAPLAVGGALGLVAFVDGQLLIVARSDNLRRVLAIPFPGGMTPTALAWQGESLLVGAARGVSRIRLDQCPQ